MLAGWLLLYNPLQGEPMDIICAKCGKHLSDNTAAREHQRNCRGTGFWYGKTKSSLPAEVINELKRLNYSDSTIIRLSLREALAIIREERVPGESVAFKNWGRCPFCASFDVSIDASTEIWTCDNCKSNFPSPSFGRDYDPYRGLSSDPLRRQILHKSRSGKNETEIIVLAISLFVVVSVAVFLLVFGQS